MRIIAKQGTELEGIFKGFYEQSDAEKKLALDMIEEFSGVRPERIGYYWVFGITHKWTCDYVVFPEGSQPKNMVEYEEGGIRKYKPNMRLKSSKELTQKWRENIHGLDGSVLPKFGIPIVDERTGTYSTWVPFRICGKYGIWVPSWLLDRMPKRNDRQFVIEF